MCNENDILHVFLNSNLYIFTWNILDYFLSKFYKQKISLFS